MKNLILLLGLVAVLAAGCGPGTQTEQAAGPVNQEPRVKDGQKTGGAMQPVDANDPR